MHCQEALRRKYWEYRDEVDDNHEESDTPTMMKRITEDCRRTFLMEEEEEQVMTSR